MQVVRRLSAKPGWILLPLLLMAVWLAREPLYALYIDWLGWVYAQMKSFHAMLTESVGQLADNPSPATAMALIVGSFLYGVFHAAGPGHGKVILSTYLLSQPEKIKKALVLQSLRPSFRALLQSFWFTDFSICSVWFRVT